MIKGKPIAFLDVYMWALILPALLIQHLSSWSVMLVGVVVATATALAFKPRGVKLLVPMRPVARVRELTSNLGCLVVGWLMFGLLSSHWLHWNSGWEFFLYAATISAVHSQLGWSVYKPIADATESDHLSELSATSRE